MKTSPPRRLHVIGGKNNGKTTLVVELVKQLTAKGLRVGTVKHTHHQHEFDTPGKDSYKHREAGAAAVGILSPHLAAAFWPVDDPRLRERSAAQEAAQELAAREAAEARYDRFAPLFHDCHLILVEGDTQTSAMKVEVWRAASGTTPMAPQDASIAVIVSDDPVDAACLKLPRSPLDPLIDWILQQLD